MDQTDQKKPKKKKGIFFKGLLLLAAIYVGVNAYNNRGDIISFIKNLRAEDIDPDDILAFSQTIPLDQDGVISITYPFVDRSYNETNGRYSIDDAYTYVYIGEGEEPTLSVISNDNLEPDNIVNFESANGYPTGVIGLKNDYANFLSEAGEIKKIALSDDNSNNNKLVPETYEVANVYSLPAGYKLYCEDKNISKQALLAYIAEDGTNVYVIPEAIIDEFVVVTENDFTIIGKYNVFRDRLADVYELYEGNRLNNGTETNYRR